MPLLPTGESLSPVLLMLRDTTCRVCDKDFSGPLEDGAAGLLGAVVVGNGEHPLVHQDCAGPRGYLEAAPGEHKCDGCLAMVKHLYRCGAEAYDCDQKKRYCLVCIEAHTGGDSARPALLHLHPLKREIL